MSFVWKCLQVDPYLQWPYWWNLQQWRAAPSIFYYEFEFQRLWVLICVRQKFENRTAGNKDDLVSCYILVVFSDKGDISEVVILA